MKFHHIIIIVKFITIIMILIITIVIVLPFVMESIKQIRIELFFLLFSSYFFWEILYFSLIMHLNGSLICLRQCYVLYCMNVYSDKHTHLLASSSREDYHLFNYYYYPIPLSKYRGDTWVNFMVGWFVDIKLTHGK